MSLLTSIFGSSKASYSPEARELVAHMRYDGSFRQKKQYAGSRSHVSKLGVGLSAAKYFAVGFNDRLLNRLNR